MVHDGEMQCNLRLIDCIACEHQMEWVFFSRSHFALPRVPPRHDSVAYPRGVSRPCVLIMFMDILPMHMQIAVMGFGLSSLSD